MGCRYIDIMLHTFNPSSCKAEAGKSLCIWDQYKEKVHTMWGKPSFPQLEPAKSSLQLASKSRSMTKNQEKINLQRLNSHFALCKSCQLLFTRFLRTKISSTWIRIINVHLWKASVTSCTFVEIGEFHLLLCKEVNFSSYLETISDQLNNLL